MKHTVDMLKYYLGQEVCLVFEDGLNKERTLTTRMLDQIYNNDIYCLYNLHPILKTVEDLHYETRNSLNKIGSRIFNKYFEMEYESFNYSFYVEGGHYGEEIEVYNNPREHLEFILELIKLGFGATPDKDSPTGYVDLFGTPCVTPKMLEKRSFL